MARRLPRDVRRPPARWPRVAGLVVLLVALLGIVPAPHAEGLEKQPYIVVLRPDVAATFDDVAAFAASADVTPLNIYSVVLQGFSAELTPAQARALRRSSLVEAVETDRRVTALAEPGLPTGVDRVGAERVNGGAGTGAGQAVAVLDSGVAKHDDLTLRSGYNCTSTNRTATNDTHGHGTHVAGIIGANGGVRGVAPGTPIIPVKVLDSQGNGSDSTIICGLDWVAGSTNNGVPRAYVINLSLGRPSAAESASVCSSSPMHRAICAATDKGITVVVAAGNNGEDVNGMSPAKYTQVVAVSALNDTDGCRGGLGPANDKGADDQRASFSNFGGPVDYAAPGVGIRSTVPGGYAVYNGTSMAAPHVAAMIALGVLSSEPSTFGEPIAVVRNGDTGCGDDDGGSAVTVGGSISGTIGTVGDTDDFTFSGRSGDRVVVAVVGVAGAGMAPSVALRSPAGATLASNSGAGTAPGEPAPPVARLDAITLATTGTHTIRVGGSTTGGYTVYLAADTGDGDTATWGWTLTTASIAPAVDVDRFPFTGTAGDVVVARMQVVGTSDLDPYLQLEWRDPGSGDWSPVAADDDSGGGRDAAIADVTLPASGDYRLVAQSLGWATAGAYRVSLTLTGSAPTPTATTPPPTPTTTPTRTPTGTPTPAAVGVDSQREGVIGAPGEIDVLVFDGVAGQRVALAAIAVGAEGLDPALVLRGPGGDQLAANDDLGPDRQQRQHREAAIASIALPVTGRYRIEITGSGGTTGHYLVEVAADDDDGRAIASGDQRSGGIVPVTDADTYVFTARAGERITSRLICGPDFDGYLVLAIDDGGVWRTLTGDDNSAGNRNALISQFSAPADATYALIVEGVGRNSTGSYALTFDNLGLAPTATPTKTPTNTPVPTATRTAKPTKAATATRPATATRAATSTRPATATRPPTRTPSRRAVSTATPRATVTPTVGAQVVATGSPTPTAPHATAPTGSIASPVAEPTA